MVDLIVSEAAQADLVQIQLYGILTFGLEASDRYSDGLKTAIARLADFPRLARERPELETSVRILPFGSHIVVYAFDGEAVRILRVRHGREDWHSDPVGDHQ